MKYVGLVLDTMRIPHGAMGSNFPPEGIDITAKRHMTHTRTWGRCGAGGVGG